MVGEFPEVQGIMGREYALLQGEDREVAAAIAEHYLPTQSGGELPSSDIGAIISIADKLDTICGCFGVGLVPTGSADPYALRRSALGIISVILDRKYKISLQLFVSYALAQLQEKEKLARKRDEVQKEVMEFFHGRFVNLMADRFPADVVEAVVAASFDDLVDAAAKIKALADFKTRPDFEPLAVAFKRVCNIVKEGVHIPVDTALLAEAADKELHAAFTRVAGGVAAKVEARDYVAALAEIATLKGVIDDFFDKVMVMAEDERVRNNRLALLTSIAGLVRNIADFAKIAA